MKWAFFGDNGRVVSAENDLTGKLVPSNAYVLTDQQWVNLYDLLLVDGNVTINHVPVIIDYLSINQSKLWQAAHDYEYSRLSGSAIGLVTIGILAGKEKCKAVQNWLTSLWDLYYERKASLSSVEYIDNSKLDFSSVGEIPYTVPELMAEVIT